MLNSYLSNKLLNDSDVSGWYVQLKGQGGSLLLSPVCFLECGWNGWSWGKNLVSRDGHLSCTENSKAPRQKECGSLVTMQLLVWASGMWGFLFLALKLIRPFHYSKVIFFVVKFCLPTSCTASLFSSTKGPKPLTSGLQERNRNFEW